MHILFGTHVGCHVCGINAKENVTVLSPLFLRKLLRGSGGRFSPRRRFGGRASKVFLLTLILILTLTLILLLPKGGLGAQPQGFDFDFFA